MNTPPTIRQGDVLLVPIEMPDAAAQKKMKKEKADKRGNLVLMHGEATGHAHTVPASHGRLLQRGTDRLLIVGKSTNLTHQEHRALWLQENTCYRVIRQREHVRPTPGMPLEVRYVRD